MGSWEILPWALIKTWSLDKVIKPNSVIWTADFHCLYVIYYGTDLKFTDQREFFWYTEISSQLYLLFLASLLSPLLQHLNTCLSPLSDVWMLSASSFLSLWDWIPLFSLSITAFLLVLSGLNFCFSLFLSIIRFPWVMLRKYLWIVICWLVSV